MLSADMTEGRQGSDLSIWVTVRNSMPQEPPVADGFYISFHPVPAPGRTDLREAEARRKFRAATQCHGRTNVSQLEDSLASTAKLENPQRVPRGQQAGLSNIMIPPIY